MAIIDLNAIVSPTGSLYLKKNRRFQPRSSLIDACHGKYVTLKDMPIVVSAISCSDPINGYHILALSKRGRLIMIDRKGERRYRTSHLKIKSYYVDDSFRMTILLKSGDLHSIDNICDKSKVIELGQPIHSGVAELLYQDRLCVLNDGSIVNINRLRNVSTVVSKLRLIPIPHTTLAIRNDMVYQLIPECIPLSNPYLVIDAIDIMVGDRIVNYLITVDQVLWYYSNGCHTRMNDRHKWSRFIHTTDNKIYIEDVDKVIRTITGKKVKLPCDIPL